MEQVRLDKVLDGVAFRDEAKAELEANLAALVERKARAAAAIVACAEQSAEIEAKLTSLGDGGDIKEKATAMADALAGCGLSDDAINSALKAQFGRVRVVDPNKPAKPPKVAADKRLTVAMGDDKQTAILAAVAAAGKEGITRAKLAEQFFPGTTGDSPESADLLCVLKNAISDGLIDRVPFTSAKGMRYYAV